MILKRRDGTEYESTSVNLNAMTAEELLNLLPPYEQIPEFEQIKYCMNALFWSDLASGFTPYEAFFRTGMEYLDAIESAPTYDFAAKLEEIYKKS